MTNPTFMSRKTTAYLLFATGVLLLGVQTTFAFLWQITGMPGAYPLSRSTILYYAQGFTPMMGALVMLLAGLIYEKTGG
jgi:hypothetical protein